MKNSEVTIEDIKKWKTEFLRWYKRKYHLDEGIFDDTPYGRMNKYTYDVLSGIFKHMISDLESGQTFSEVSKEFYNNLVSEV